MKQMEIQLLDYFAQPFQIQNLSTRSKLEYQSISTLSVGLAVGLSSD
jgi:hypothetical protein